MLSTSQKKDASYFESTKRKAKAKVGLDTDLFRENLEWHRGKRKHHMGDPSTKFLIMVCHRPKNVIQVTIKISFRSITLNIY